jgi:hypothetical protein
VARGAKAADVPDLGDDEQGDEDADGRDAGEHGDAGVVLGAGPDLPLHGLQLAIELGDEREQALEPTSRRRGQGELAQEAPSPRAEEFGATVLDSLAGEQGMDTVLERRAQTG